jgi:hypothetical protein
VAVNVGVANGVSGAGGGGAFVIVATVRLFVLAVLVPSRCASNTRTGAVSVNAVVAETNSSH